MTKTDLVTMVAQKTGLSKKDADKAVNGVLDAISEALTKKDSVRIAGFGTFVIRQRAERKGRNPQTGEEITIPAAVAVGFTAAKSLKAAVQG